MFVKFKLSQSLIKSYCFRSFLLYNSLRATKKTENRIKQLEERLKKQNETNINENHSVTDIRRLFISVISKKLSERLKQHVDCELVYVWIFHEIVALLNETNTQFGRNVLAYKFKNK